MSDELEQARARTQATTIADAESVAASLAVEIQSRLPEGYGFLLMVEPKANGAGAVTSNMKPAHLRIVLRKLAKGMGR